MSFRTRFKRCHLDGGLVAIVVWKFCQKQIIFLLSLRLQDTNPYHVLENLINSLILPVCFKMTRVTKVQISHKSFLESLL